MQIKTYKITKATLEGFIVVTYQDGTFKACLNEVKQGVNKEIWESFRANLPFKESLIKTIATKGFEVLEKEYDTSNLEGKPGYERTKMFCSLYEAAKGRKYKVFAGEGKKIQTVPVTAEIINYYLRGRNFLWDGKWSISNMVRYWNELMTEMNEGRPAMVFPKYYSAEYERQLLPVQVPYYHNYLIKTVGLIPIRHTISNEIIGFKTDKTVGDFMQQKGQRISIENPTKK